MTTQDEHYKELEQLRDQWRDAIRISIARLEDSATRAERHTNEIRVQIATFKHLEGVDGRLRALEEFKARMWGGMLAANLIGGGIIAVIGILLKH